MRQHASIDEYLAALSDERRAEVNALRDLVRDAEPALVEIVKWNSPTFTLAGEDRLTINAAGTGSVRLILHLGTAIAEDKRAATTFTGDPDGLLTWHSDIRASLVAGDPAATANVVRAWLQFRRPERPKSLIGFLEGRLLVPDDFDTMSAEEITPSDQSGLT